MEPIANADGSYGSPEMTKPTITLPCPKPIHITNAGYNGYAVGDTMYGLVNGTLTSVVLKEGDILAGHVYWLTEFELANLKRQFDKLPLDPDTISREA